MTRTLSWHRDIHLNRIVAGTLICTGHVYMYEGSCQYTIKMYVPSHDSVRVMYMGIYRKMFGSCMCMRVPATILLRCMCHARTTNIVLVWHIPVSTVLACQYLNRICAAHTSGTMFGSCTCTYEGSWHSYTYT